MGRMRRMRKLKSCDPFNKKNINSTKQKSQQKNKQNDKFDKPPSKAELNDNNFGDSIEFQRFQAFVELGTSNKKISKKSEASIAEKPTSKGKAKEKISKVVANCQQQPGETKKDMFRRLDENIHNAMSEAIKDEKPMRKKRKEHLKARDEKRKNKGKPIKQTPNGEVIKDFSSLHDQVKFGERVDEPPTITSAPRKASIKTQPKTLQLHSLFEKNDDNKEPTTKTKTSPKAPTKKRRREMDEKEKESFDTERQRAIDAYRLAKKRREMKNT